MKSLYPALLALLLVPLISSAQTTQESELNAEDVCTSYGLSINDAQIEFSAQCPWLVRETCEEITSGGWACSTSAISNSVNRVDSTSTQIAQGDSCTAYGSTINDAQTAFSAECPWRVRETCDLISSGSWACSTVSVVTSVSDQITQVETTSLPVEATPTIADVADEVVVEDPSSGTVSGSDSTTTDVSSTLQIKANSVSYNSSLWSPSEGGLVYTGLNRYLLTSQADDANLEFNFNIPAAGSYRFTMRSRAGDGNDPAEPPNDVWLKVANTEWLKVYMSRDGSWQTDAIGERNGEHSRDLNTYDLDAGPVLVIVSGRSQGHILDWVALEPQGSTVAVSEPAATVAVSTSSTSVVGTGVMNTRYQPGDLVVIAHDSGPDTDDMQAIVANRMIMDAYPDVNYVLVGATQGHDWTNPTEGSESHTQSLFPEWVNAKASTTGTTSFDGNSILDIANRIEDALNNSGTVHIAEGGPSDFTAEVIRVLQSRGVQASALKRVRVVQHSAGSTAWNEQQTSSSNIALVKSAATWVPIANGNVGGNATADFQEPASSSMCQRFMSSASGTPYASQWAWAYSTIGDARKCDQSDSVELLFILNETSTKTFDQFASRYM